MPTTARASRTAFAPGRVNLIGEHTDYNDGLALPFAITAGVRVQATPGAIAGMCVVTAADLGESDRFPITDPEPVGGWRAFPHGVVAELAAIGITVPSAELRISGDLPRGAGLSSSAALEVALSLALLELAGHCTLETRELARLCSRVENDWVGTQSGLLDPLAILCSTPGHAVLIDFATLELEPVPLELGGAHLVAVASGQEHDLQSSGYNARRRECEQACAALGIASLREATLEAAADLPEPLSRRVRHVVEENARVREAVQVLGAGEPAELGALLNASHASLRDLYEVSTDQVERTVENLRDYGALGARVVGGGFGGSVLALLPSGLAAPAGAMVLTPGRPARLLTAAENV